MKESYELARARHNDEKAQMSEDKMATGRRPKQVDMGTQMKLLKPRTRMATPAIRDTRIFFFPN